MNDDTARVWRALATTALGAAGLTCLTYAGWLVTARRGLYADIADTAYGEATVSLAAARSSDALDAGWSTAATLLIAAALVLWAAARFLAGRRTGAVGLAALSLVGAGLLGVVVGAQVAATGGTDPTEAGRAAVGCWVLAVGFLLAAIGLLAGAAGLLLGPRAPYLGYAGWSAG